MTAGTYLLVGIGMGYACCLVTIFIIFRNPRP